MKKIMLAVIKIVIFLIFISICSHFLVPINVGIVNVGNITGAVVSAIIALTALFFGTFRKMAAVMWEHTAGRIFLSAVGGIVSLCVIGALVISGFMLGAMRDKPDGKPTTLIVLGCQINGTTPSRMLMHRLDTAYDYLTEHEDICVIVSGGQGSDEITSEADVMQQYLINKGISENRIFMEDKSTSTEENLKFSREIIDREGLCGDITIVTDGFHQFRSDIFAKRQGFKAYNLSAETEGWLLPTYWIREWFGVLHCLVFK